MLADAAGGDGVAQKQTGPGFVAVCVKVTGREV